MYFAEAIVSILIMSFVYFLWMNYIDIEDKNYQNHLINLEKQSINISLHNYITNINNWSWYITLSWYDFLTGNSWNYYYSCKEKTWNLINTNIPYTGNFCYVNYENNKIYNYNLN